MQLPNGLLKVDDVAIARIVGYAASECYGVVGMVSRNAVLDNINGLLGRENLGRGVEVHAEKDTLSVDVYIIVSFGVRIIEVARNVIDHVHYAMEKTSGLPVDRVNVVVQGVRRPTE
ncbi:MAG: Asp23/Gls24 family envelope stress response protein [Firmicutes bacterium]|nr:Asp23/Gls24 family envelope stress response protein [Bacillota bacterium]